MQQTTIRFDEELQVQQPVSMMAQTRCAVQVINVWLSERSEFFSSLAEFSVTRMQVMLVHLILVLIGGAVVSVNFSFTLTFLLLACAAWAVYGLNMTEKGGRNE